MEFDRLSAGLTSMVGTSDTVRTCGFGLIASAAKSSLLIARHRPSRVELLGIAGGYGSQGVGTAITFDHVQCLGIGVGGEFVDGVGRYQSASQLGWRQIDEGDDSVDDCIELPFELPCNPNRHPNHDRGLLSVTASSASPSQASHRANAYPDAIAEDMEGFGVALACKLAGVPLRIIRGISNHAGDRNLDGWQIDAALDAVFDYFKTHRDWTDG